MGLGETVYSIEWCSPIHTVLKPPASAMRVSSVRFSKHSWCETDSSQRSMWTKREKRMSNSFVLQRLRCCVVGRSCCRGGCLMAVGDGLVAAGPVFVVDFADDDGGVVRDCTDGLF